MGVQGTNVKTMGTSSTSGSQQASGSQQSSRPRRARSRFNRLINRLAPGVIENPLETGLSRLNDRLGLGLSDSEGTGPSMPRAATALHVENTKDAARSIFYAPDMDGQAEPGEVVWIWTPSDDPTSPLRERAILVVGRTRHTILGLLISPNPEHDGEDSWLDIGAGEWDSSGRQCWIRLDKVLEVSELGIRRQGAVLPRRRFERVANKLRQSYSWM